MGLLYWLLIGLAAGAIAKWITPQKEKGGWLSSLIVGIIGSMVGGFIARLTGLSQFFGNGLFVATGGAILVLFIYHRFLAHRMNIRL